jgi:D-alanyl-lipoteichoic acid acyltransferase DltB (MBOAT superfamily)
MLFASFDFLLFFTVAFAGYWALSGRPGWRALWVILASYFFYMASSKPVEGPLPTPWYFVGLLITSTLVDYLCGLRIAAVQAGFDASEPSPQSGSGVANARRPRPGRVWLVASILTNLGLLGYFKYTGFLLEVISDTAELVGVEAGLPAVKMLLPVGISFYTFQSLSYTIDVYRGRLPAERNLLKFALFVAFFPQLVAGPIVRASEFLPQLRHRPTLTRQDVDFAIWRVTKGLVKKVVLGDFIAASFTDGVFAAPAEYSSLENLLALYAFTLQIYADFSGYSDIAIGIGRLLGFRIPENFNRPYQAVDVADFWRRWHMTLSNWLRDYVYYPLGGSRCSEGRTYVNLWVTMFLVGIWHGASWNFVIYAALQACAMVYHRFCQRQVGSRKSLALGLVGVSVAAGVGGTLLGSIGLELADPYQFGLVVGGLAFVIGILPTVRERPASRPFHVVLTFHFCVLSRVFFRADSLDSARAMAHALVNWDGFGVRAHLFDIPALSAWIGAVPALAWARPMAYWGVLVLMITGFFVHFTPPSMTHTIGDRLVPRVPAVVMGMGLAALMGVVSLMLAGPRPNIYFAF